MTDKELLELAAKAAGIKINWSTQGIHKPPVAYADGCSTAWNPLTDDGDALRLAVKLDILIDAAFASATEKIEYEIDQLAATRRAIVRAAAEIGKVMK